MSPADEFAAWMLSGGGLAVFSGVLGSMAMLTAIVCWGVRKLAQASAV